MDPHFQNNCTVSGTLGLVIRISQIFGVAALKVENARNSWHIRVSRAASLYDKSVIIFLCILTTIGVTWDMLLGAEDSSFRHFTQINAVMFMGMAIAISSALLVQAFSGVRRMQNMITCLIQIRKINAELALYGPLKSYEKSKFFWALFILVGGVIIVVADYGIFLYHINITHNNVYVEILYISHFLKYVMLKVLTVQITLIFTTVLSSFNHLNDCLNNLMQQLVRQCTNKVQYPGPTVVQRLGCLYCCLCDVVQKLDKSHGVVLVPIIGSFLLHLVVTPHVFITKMLGTKTDFYYAMIQIFWAVYHCLDVIMIVEPCHRTQEQMDRTKQLISQLLRVTPPEYHKLIAEEELFYKHVMVNEAIYAPINLFQLNRALLLTIFGSVTTYLVVVIKL